MKRKFCYLYLTCESGEEQKLAQVLLEKHLVACAKFVPIQAMYWWQGDIARGDETLIIFESAEDLYAEVEAEVAKIHSYETFVLTQVAMTEINVKAAAWLEESLKKQDDKNLAKLV